MVRMGWSAIEWTPKVAGGGERTDRDAMRVQMLLGPDTPHTIIRRNDLEPPQAMIAVRGMEGARDETVMFLRHRARWDGTRRVYLFKSGGGAAARLLDPATWRARPGAGPRPREHALSNLAPGRERGRIGAGQAPM